RNEPAGSRRPLAWSLAQAVRLKARPTVRQAYSLTALGPRMSIAGGLPTEWRGAVPKHVVLAVWAEGRSCLHSCQAESLTYKVFHWSRKERRAGAGKSRHAVQPDRGPGRRLSHPSFANQGKTRAAVRDMNRYQPGERIIRLQIR